jgi:imidazole glycerol-phosphate synthase subunit HisF
MYRARVIPCLLLRGHGLVKTRKFKDPVYVGDPVNAVRIFSDKEVDELVLLDIEASRLGREPDYELIAEIAGECFMPVAYGGGVRTLEQVRRLIRSGVEKVVINSAATESTQVITDAAQVFGSQAVVAAVDVKRSLLGAYKVMAKAASLETRLKLEEHVQALVRAGAGEIFLNSVDRDGMMAGYDLDLVRAVAAKTSVPLVVCGGAGHVEHLRQAVQEAGASAVCAGSMFVFHGKHRAVLINYPSNLHI